MGPQRPLSEEELDALSAYEAELREATSKGTDHPEPPALASLDPARRARLLAEVQRQVATAGRPEEVPEGWQEPLVGMLLAGRYRLLERIGAGAMGTVFRARAVADEDSLVAVKVLSSPAAIARIQREARRLSHPNIVDVREVWAESQPPFVVMELVEGRTLESAVGEHPVEDHADFALRFATIVDAVAYAHGKGILHRDLKPANILVSARGRWVLADFGLSKGPEDESISGTWMAVGSRGYIAPECRRSSASATPRSDLFGLGAVLYYCLTGEVPDDDPLRPRPRSLDARIPRDLEAVCLKCLEERPAERYASAQALAGDLRAMAAGRAISAPRPNVRSRLRRWARYRPAAASALGVGLVALVVLASISKRYSSVMAEERSRVASALDLAEERAGGLLALGLPLVQILASERFQMTGLVLESEPLLDDLAAQLEVLGESDLDSAGFRGLRGHVQNVKAAVLLRAGHLAESIAASEAARDCFHGAGEATAERSARHGLAVALLQLGSALGQSGRLGEAVEALDEARALLAELARLHDDDPKLLHDLGTAHGLVGNCLAAMDQAEGADLAYGEAVTQLARATEAVGGSTPYRIAWIQALSNRSLLKLGRGDTEASVALAEEALRLADELSLSPDVRECRALMHTNYADALAASGGDPERVLRVHTGALQLYEGLASESPEALMRRWDHAMALSNVGWSLLQIEVPRCQEALDALDRASNIYDDLLEQWSEVPGLRAYAEENRTRLVHARSQCP